MPVKLSRSEASNYRYFAGTLGVGSAAISYFVPSKIVSVDVRNGLAASMGIIALGCLSAGWNKRDNFLTKYFVPEKVRDW